MALLGSGIAGAAPSSEGSSGLSGLSSTSPASSEGYYDFENWDTCPWEDMLAPDENGNATQNWASSCLTFVIKGGEINLGGMNIEIEPSSMMLAGGEVPATHDWFPDSGWLHASPITVPGGALGTGSEDFGPLGITAHVEEAGTSQMTGTGIANLGFRMPVKLKLSNPLLGNNCYIGSDDDPIVFSLDIDENTISSDPSRHGSIEDTVGGGTYYTDVEGFGDDFSVPEASGCGAIAPMDWAVNLRAGLPSPAGSNSISITTDYYYTSAMNLLWANQ